MESQKRRFNVNVSHTISDDVWVGLSDDIDGLTIESDGFTNFLNDLTKYGAELLCHNHGFTQKDLTDIELRCNVTHEFDAEKQNFNRKSRGADQLVASQRRLTKQMATNI